MRRTREENFNEVKCSKDFVQYGKSHLATPGSRSRLTARLFSDLYPAEVKIYCISVIMILQNPN